VSESTGSHRHDTGHPAHGPETTEHMTTALQGVLGICIAITCGLVIWAALAAI
jgi:hypothetical protein